MSPAIRIRPSHRYQTATVSGDLLPRTVPATAPTVYPTPFGATDDTIPLVDAADDHHAQVLQSTIDGYVDCVRTAGLDADTLGSTAGVIDERALTGVAILRKSIMEALEA